MTFYSVIDIDRTPWFQKFVSFVGVESNQVVLTGYGGPVKNLLTKKAAKDFELSLNAKFPAIMSPDFRIWLNSRQFELKGGVKRALGKPSDTTSTSKDSTKTPSVPTDSTVAADSTNTTDSTKNSLVAKYTPFIELKETIKGSFGNRKEHSFYRSLNLSQETGQSDVGVKVEYGTEDTISLGLPWLGIHDAKLTFDLSKDKVGVELKGGFAIGGMKVADTILVAMSQDVIKKADTSKVSSDSTTSSTTTPDNSKTGSSPSDSTKNKFHFNAKAKLSDDFSLNKLIQIIQKTVSDKSAIPAVNIPADLFDLSDISLGLTGGNNSEMYIMAQTSLMNSKSDLFLSLAKNHKNERQFTVGVKPVSWKLTEAIPLLSNPVLDNLDFSNVGFVITNEDSRISSEDLGPDSREFYSKLYASDQYELVLKPGINIISVIPLENLEPDDPLIKLMDHLGMHSKGILLQGSFGNVFGLMTGKSGEN